MEDNKLNTAVFLDMLGFSSTVSQDPGDATAMLANYDIVVNQKESDIKSHPLDSYPEGLRHLAEMTSLSAVKYFLPFSDSIAMASSDIGALIPQVARFVLECFDLCAHDYKNPFDHANPKLKQIPSIEHNENGELIAKRIIVNNSPVLFRGGISFGEVYERNLFAKTNGENSKNVILFGKAIVDAVNLEKCGLKGPRIFISKQDVEKISRNSDAHKYLRKTPENEEIYEVLWPATKYITENRAKDEIVNFNTMFIPAYNLWKPYIGSDISIHYEKFIRLIIVSTIQLFDKVWDKKEYATDYIRNTIQREVGSKMFENFIGECHT